jgi:uncharacterized protein
LKDSSDNPNKTTFFIKRSEIPYDVHDVFNYHARYRAIDRLIPPWSFLKIIKRNNGLENGATSILGLQYGPLKLKWIAKHFGYIQDQIFQDEMIKGPFKNWKHIHSFTPNKLNGCIIEDKIEYSLPYGLNKFYIFRNRLNKTLYQMFSYRHRILQNDLKLWDILKENKGKRILISGSTGLIGSALIPFLDTSGEHNITRLVRPSSKYADSSNNSNSRVWDPDTGKVDPSDLEGFDTIIHLCGESIGGRWSKIKKKRIYDSRVMTTELLCNTIKKLKNPPSTMLCASAIGYYGSHGEEVVTEETTAGDGFLANLCVDWEAQAKSVEAIGIRVVYARFGLILSPKGGIVKLLNHASFLKAGITFGSGSNVFNWVSIEDVIGSILYSIGNTTIHGPVNVVSPNPVKASDFSEIISKILENQFLLRIGYGFMKLAMGDFADTISDSNGVVKPQKLMDSGYPFMNPNLEDALRLLLGRQIENKTEMV